MVVGNARHSLGERAPPMMFDFAGGEPGALVVSWA
jgi:hypothetical protein